MQVNRCRNPPRRRGLNDSAVNRALEVSVEGVGKTSAQMALRDPDIRLMLQVRADDAEAFAELVERYQHRVVGIMNHLLGNTGEAEDLAQEVFLRIYRTRKKYTPRAKFSTWLFTIANNLALNVLRRRQRKPTVPLPAQDSGPLGPRPQEQLVVDPGLTPAHGLKQRELAAIIRRALDELNERQRLAVVLNKFEEMNYAEIAEVMGLTTKAVKSLLNRARGKLREALQPYVFMDAPPPAPPPDDD
jgi:RNA polymerase sigma-70 factor (ECF subfamily)